MRKKWSLLIIIILLLYLVLELALPLLAEKEIRQGFEQDFDRIENLEVDVNSFPVLEILLSRTDRLTITGSSLYYSGLEIRDLLLEYEDVSWREQKIRGDNVDLKLVVTEKGLNEYIAENYSELSDFELEFNPESVLLTGSINVFNNKIEVEIAGELVLEGNNQLVFEPENIQLDRISLPSSLLENVLEKVEFRLNLDRFDFPLEIEVVKIEEDRCQLLGGMSARKAGF